MRLLFPSAGGVVLTLLMAAPAKHGEKLALQIADYPALPITGSPDGAGNNAGALARVNTVREEPAPARRLFANDLTGPLYILDRNTRTFTAYLDLNGRGARTGLFDKLATETGLASLAAENHPGTVAEAHEMSISWNDPTDSPDRGTQIYPTMAGVVTAGYHARGGKDPDLPGTATVSGSGRVDLRLALDRSGELYVLSKSDGMIRAVTGVVPVAAGRDALLRLIDRPRVPLAPDVQAMPSEPSVVQEHFTFASQAGERVPGVLLKSRAGKPRRPAVILLHGTGGGKNDTQIVKLSEALAARGIIAVAIDGRYHGERVRPGARATDYVAAMLQAYRTPGAHPFLYDTVWDVMRLIDYLETRLDVDATRIGVMGISKGGMETYLAAAADPRIAAAVPVIGVQSFRWALDHDSWQSRVGTFQAAIDAAAADGGVKAINAAFVRRFYDRVVPGIYSEFDAPAVLPLIAPRPLLAINGDSDPRTPLPGVQEAAAAAERAYRAAHAADRFVLYVQPNTGHAFGDPAQQVALDWLVRWLKP